MLANLVYTRPLSDDPDGGPTSGEAPGGVQRPANETRLPRIEDGPVQGPPKPLTPAQRPLLNLLLFVATVATTSLFVSPVYSVCLMAILTAHEFGHYLAARYHRVPASLPYFIPAPFLFGTMGAVIRMSPLIPNRRALFDIGAAGPLAGVVLAIPITFVGVMLSERVPQDPDMPGILLGDPLLFKFFERLVFGAGEEGMVLMLHDVGFAGWVGLFVTALNLIPIGQLDGGHVAYAVFGRHSVRVAWVAFASLLAFSIANGAQYALLLVLLFLTGIRHRPTLRDSLPIGIARVRAAIVLLVVFLICFIPIPVVMPG
ncbi:MAG: site-2 protease family protein [Bryobacterales bacterium]|nr:site-2 protease family protein [Bryobacterales bacterium]